MYTHVRIHIYIYIIQNSRWWNLGKKRNKFGIESGILCYCKLSRLQHADGVIFGCLSWWIDGMSSLLSSTLVRSSSSSFLGSINLQIEPWYLVYYSILYPQITQYYSSIVLQLNSTGLLDLYTLYSQKTWWPWCYPKSSRRLNSCRPLPIFLVVKRPRVPQAFTKPPMPCSQNGQGLTYRPIPYLVGGDWNHGILNDFPYIGNNHPKWRTHIFQRGWNHQPDIVKPE